MPRPKGFFIDGRQLKSQREAAGWTQDALAANSGLTRSAVQKAERGGALSTRTIEALCATLRCSASDLVLSEDWNHIAGRKVISPANRKEVPKVGSVWKLSRETLYAVPPHLLQALALRNLARVLPVYAPRSRAGREHFLRLATAITDLRREASAMLDGRQIHSVSEKMLQAHADNGYLAAGFARAERYEQDMHAADSAFAIGIAAARTAEAAIAGRRLSRAADDANHWRMLEFSVSACHATVHTSVYLGMEDAFIRTATLDTHDLLNSRTAWKVLQSPLWESGNVPVQMQTFMTRLIRQSYFPHDVRILWNRWSRWGFSEEEKPGRHP